MDGDAERGVVAPEASVMAAGVDPPLVLFDARWRDTQSSK